MTDNKIRLTYDIKADDFTRAGEASSSLKAYLRQMGIAPDIIRKTAICMYEGEINMVIHAKGGVIFVDITADEIIMTLKDEGPGIKNIDQAMIEGFSTAPDNIRLLGFGAGMGLPNMKKYSDEMNIETVIGKGTTVTLKVKI